MKDYQNTLIGLIGVVVLLLMFAIFALLKWPGKLDEKAVDDSGHKQPVVYGERVHWNSLVRQPVSTWSNMGAVLIGLGLLLWLERTRAASEVNPMCGATMFSVAYAYLVIFLGPGSMFFHGSMTQWGGFLDNLSMNFYISFILVYDLYRIARFERWVFWLVCGAVNIVAAVPILIWGIGTVVFGILIGLTLLLEALILFGRVGGVQRQWPFLAVGLGIFVVAFAIWILSQTSGTFLYMPDSWFQGHGVWHILSAVAALCFLTYFRTERASLVSSG